jgi:hypothetical protein
MSVSLNLIHNILNFIIDEFKNSIHLFLSFSLVHHTQKRRWQDSSVGIVTKLAGWPSEELRSDSW